MEQSRLLRPMGLLEIIDQSFRLYRATFWPFFGIAVVPSFFVAVAAVALLTAAHAMQASVMDVESLYGFIIALAVFYVVIIAAQVVENAALTKAIADRYLGRPVTVRGSYAFVLRRGFVLVVTIMCALLLILPGMVLLVVPGIIFAFWAAFMIQALLVEDKRYFAAIMRSRFLIGNGVWAELLGLLIIMGLIQGVAFYALVGVFSIPQFILGERNLVANIIAALGNGLGSAFTGPLGPIATTLMYFNSRIRKEGFDLQLLAQEMGLPAVAAPAPEGAVKATEPLPAADIPADSNDQNP